MTAIKSMFTYMSKRYDLIIQYTVQHLQIVLIALAISIVVSVIIGYLITFNKKVASVVLYICSVLMTIPSLALFVICMPIFGLGAKPAIVGIFIYTLLPIVRNVYVGLTNIDHSIIDSARGMGLTELKISLKIKIPLALPVAFAGIRTSVVMGVGLAAIAAYVGAGGLGQLIFQGINRGKPEMTLTGAVIISLITIVLDKLMGFIQKRAERSIS